MPRTPYNWGNGPAELHPHSLAKHTILREYVERYVDILMKSGKSPQLRITLVDGFAGGGEYVVKGQEGKIHDGSPLILINAVDAATKQLNLGRKKPVEVDADFVFIEKERAAFEYLRSTLAKRFDRSFLERKVRLIQGAFKDHVWEVVSRLRPTSGRRPKPIFVLDQYGYSHIPVDMIAGIMRECESAEVFLTLAVDHIHAYATSLEDARQKLRSSLHLPPIVDAFIAGKRVMDEGDGLDDGTRSEIMHYIQVLLHEAFANHAGARCYTPFFITSKDSRRSYWFLHLANNARANDAVKELHWKIANSSQLQGHPGFQHHGRPGTKMLLGFDPSKARGQLAFDFVESDRDRTVKALIEELPQLLQEKYRKGVSLKSFYGSICNETPASKLILGQALNALCSAGELVKQGAKGERRETTTSLQDDDIIRPAHQGRLFSIPQLLGDRRPR